MDERIKKYVDAIIEAKGGEKNLFGIPTDIIGFDEFGRNLAIALEPLITKKEICFFDLDIQQDDNYHFLNFKDMFQKSELMIFTKELPESFFDDLSNLNPNVKIIIDSNFKTIIERFKENGFSNNIIII